MREEQGVAMGTRGITAGLTLALVVAAAASACGSAATPSPSATPPGAAGPTPIVLPVSTPWVASPPMCPAALLHGQLVPNPEWGLALIPDSTSTAVKLIWPAGYTARAGTVIEVLDKAGRVVAREWDRVALPGGYLQDGAWGVCPGLDAVAAPS
jgi:hypothetical protein